mgnify:CR=1 FL=1|jgi:uncharacterized membrane-anchored protein YjiN (DUF445 family)|tara:strand:+ start:101 stop:850 length:750 start_codon:yes stop_codon:yes gene_type:complete
MTTDGNDLTQIIDQAQHDIDVEQGVVDTTSEESQVQALQSQLAGQTDQIRQLTSMVNASRGHTDRALNAIRGGVDQAVEEKIASLGEKARQAQLLETINEDQRPIFQSMMERLDKIDNKPQAQEVGEQAPIDSDTQAQWKQVYTMVEQMGINPQDNRINYQLLVDQSVATPEQRQGNFMQNLTQILGSNNSQQPQSVGRSPSTNPPVESMSPSTSTAFRNSEDIRDAYIAGKITTDVYHERMRAIGEDI